MTSFPHDVVIIGGGGHVGLPLGIAFAARGRSVVLYDISQPAVDTINAGVLPFREAGADELLPEVLASGALVATTDPRAISQAEHVIVVVGTPVDAQLTPDAEVVPRAVAHVADRLRPGQLVVLRSTVFPGVTKRVEQLLAQHGVDVDIAFCPERIVEGKALEEIFTLPQLIAARTDRGRARATALFASLTDSLVQLSPEEAELAKLFTNAWRYIKFATANQLFMLAAEHGLDYDRIREGLAQDYPRAADLPRAGFAAGPCLFKDTVQLSASAHHTFAIGNAAIHVNEGLPHYLVSRVERRFDLSTMRVGILGMAFKGDSDDRRSSLSYKLKGILAFRALEVLTADPFVTDDPDLVEQEKVFANCDLIFIGAPHTAYRDMQWDGPVADIWGVTGLGGAW